MKCKFRPALLLAACLLWPAQYICAQDNPQISETSSTTGSLSGIVQDSTGAVIPRAKVEVKSRAGFQKDSLTDRAGRFVISAIPIGTIDITVSAPGFSTVILRDRTVDSRNGGVIRLTLPVASPTTNIVVSDAAIAKPQDIEAGVKALSRSTAEIAAQSPGIDLRSNGELAAMPILHGMGDERTKVVVDGVTTENSCPNHMNPSLASITPARAAHIAVIAGITPVSLGGDSLSGTIAVDSPDPVFADSNARLYEEGTSTGYYRSNGESYGGSVNEWLAGRNLGVGYSGSFSQAENYTDGAGHKVTSTYAQSTDHTVTLAAQGKGNLFVIQAGLHHVPYEGFVNAQMDLVRDYSERLNARWRRSLGTRMIDARIFWQNTFHSMNVGRNKLKFPMPMWMPMDTHGRDIGYIVRYELPLSARHTVRLGNELHRFILDDRWPPVTGTAPMMAPDTFININNGHRLRVGTYAEVLSKWTPQWSTLLGVRNDTVRTNADPVQGYSAMYAKDAAAFNAAKRRHTDANIDATALVRYEPNSTVGAEIGYAHKSRTPNLYERYAWSTNWMASAMIGWFGDGNFYVGNTALQSEAADTVSGSLMLHNQRGRAWELKVTPYFTHIDNYVDVNTQATRKFGMSNFARLQFANHTAQIFGGDLSGSVTLWNGDAGRGKLSAIAGWVHGTRTDSDTPLYQMMPLNTRVSFDEEWKGLALGATAESVDRKSLLDPNRMEQTTPGYTLLHLRTMYHHGPLQGGIAAENVFNRAYELPLGGVNLDDFLASMRMSQIKPLTGRGRSVSFYLSATF